MKKAVLTRFERALPFLRLAELYATKGVGAGCKDAADEATAWASAM